MAGYDSDIVLSVDLDTGDVISTSEKLGGDIERIFDRLNKKGTSINVKSAMTSLDSLYQRAQQLQSAIIELDSTQIKTPEYKKLEDELKSVSSEFTKLLQKQSEFEKRAPAGAFTEYEKRKERLSELSKQSEQINKQMWQFKPSQMQTSEYKKLESQLRAISIEYSNLIKQQQEFEKRVTSSGLAAYEARTKTLDALQTKREELQDKISQMEENGTAFTGGDETSRYQQLVDQLNTVNNKIVIAKQKLDSLGDTAGPEQAGERVGQLSGKFSSLIASISRLGSSIININAVKKGLDRVKTSAKKAAQQLLKVASAKIKSGLKSLGQSFGLLKKESDGSSKAFKKGLKMLLQYGLGVRSLYFLARKLRKALTEGFGDLAQVHAPFNQAMSSIMTALRTLRNSFASAFAPIIETVAPILTRFINLIADAVNKIGMFIAALTGKEFVKAVPVYQDYAASVDKSSKSSDKASKSMKNQNKAAKELKRTLAGFDDVEILHEDRDTDTSSDTTDTTTSPGGFAPGSISSAVNDFAQKFKEAWKNADFYDIGRLVGEKLKNALENIPWDKIKTTLSNIAKSIATFLNGFLETPGLFKTIGKTLAEAINSAVTFVNSFVKNFNWASLGTAIKDLLLSTFKNIDWKLIYDTVAALGKGIGTAIQNALNDAEVWEAIFTAIGNRLEAVLLFLYNFLDSINWSDMGKNIATGLNNAIENFDWSLLARTLSKAVQSAIDLLYEFVSTFNFYEFGSHIGSALSEAIGGVDWMKGGAALARAINGLFSALNGFLVSMDWGNLGAQIINFIKGFFADFKWSSISETISNLWVAFHAALTGAITNIDWASLPQNIIDAITDFFDGFDWDAMAESVGGFLGAAFGAIATLGGALWNKMKAFGRSIMNGGLKGILERMKDIGSWIYNHIVKPFVDAFKEKFGITGDSKAGKLFLRGVEVIGSFLNGIISIVSNIADWIYNHIIKPFVEGFKSIVDPEDDNGEVTSLGSRIIRGIFHGIINVIGSVGTWINNRIVTPFIRALKEYFGIDGTEGGVFEVGVKIIKGIFRGIVSVITGIGKWIYDHVVTPFINGFKTVFAFDSENGSLLDLGIAIIDGILNGIVEALISIGTWIHDNIFEPIIKGFKDIFGIHSPATSTEFIGTNIIKGIFQGILNTILDVADWIKTNIFEPIIEGFKTIFGFGDGQDGASSGSIFDIGASIINTIFSGIGSIITGIGDWIETHIFDPIVEGLKSIFGFGDGQDGASSGSIFDIGASILNTLFSGILSIASTIGTFLYENIIEPITSAFANLGQSIMDFFNADWENEYGFDKMQGATATTDEFAGALNNLSLIGQEFGRETAWNDFADALYNLNEAGKLSDEALLGLQDTIVTSREGGMEFEWQVDMLAATLEKAGVSSSDLNAALSGSFQSAKEAGLGIEDLSTKAEGASGNTENVGTALDAFKDLSLSVPLKLALLAAAIKALGDQGKLSDEDVEGLQTKLDEADSENFETVMGDVGEALSNGGISAGDFSTAMTTAVEEVDTSVGTHMNSVLTSVTDMSDDLKEAGQTDGENINNGLIAGMEAKKQELIDEAQTVVDTYILDTMDTAADSHSPSKEAQTRGENIIAGLINGIEGKQEDVSTAAKTTIATFLTVLNAEETLTRILRVGESYLANFKVGLTPDENYFTSTGTTIIDTVVSALNASEYKLTLEANSMVGTIKSGFESQSWYSVGTNIGDGIYNGLVANSDRLKVLAWNTAVDMYNAANAALGIASPSKKFAWIGQMIMRGWEGGLADNAKLPLNTIESTIDTLTSATEDLTANTSSDSLLSSMINSLDNVLTRFSDIITDRFTNLIASLEKLSVSAIPIPDIARGNVVPNNIASNRNRSSDMTQILTTLDRLVQNQISLEALTSNITQIMQTYGGDLYIGDEQIARHANAGNVKLNRRYNTV